MYGTLLLVTTGLCLVSYLLLLPIFDYFRDPKGLRRYPNFRFASGISNLPFIHEAHKGFRSHALLEAHKTHPILRIGPNSLSFSDPQAIKDIYGHQTKCIKDLFYSTLTGSHSHLADVIDKSEHARKRKILSSAYAIKNLEAWEFKVWDLTNRTMKAFDARCTAPLQGKTPTPEDLTVDYRHWTNLFTISAIASIGLSEDLGFLDRGNDEVSSEQMDGKVKDVSFRECLFSTAWAQSNLIWSYDWYKVLVRASNLLSSTYRTCWRLNKDWDGIVYSRATKRLQRYQTGEKLDDFFQALMLDKSGQPTNLPWGEIVAEISIMMNAGSDTTAIAMHNTMYLLLKNPKRLFRLRAELDAALDDENDTIPSYDKLKHLPYLRACIDESLRLLPPVSFNLPRRTPPEGTTIDNTYVPGNTSVSMSAYVLHRDSTVFPDPETYNPDRWLGTAGKELQPYFVAFSMGARGCIGRNISYLEQMVVLAFMVRRYEFALRDPKWTPKWRENTTLSPGQMWVKVWRRQRGGGIQSGIEGEGTGQAQLVDK